MNNQKNLKNKNFWSKNPMTYVDFKKNINERLPKDKKDYSVINKKLIISNPDFLNIIKSYKKKLIKKTVLDLGCGFGSSSIILSKYVKQLYAIDLTNIAIKNTKQNLQLNNIKNVKALQMDAENLKFKNNFFDFIFSWGVIHHSNNPKKILENIKYKLKNGGSCFLMVYNFYSFRYIFLSSYFLFVKGYIFKGYNFTTICSKFTDGYYNKHYRSKEFTNIIKRIGFKNITITFGHHRGRIAPLLKSHDSWLGRFLSRKFGYFLYAYFEK